MKIQQFIKSLNNTEIGKGGTHECYVRVSESVKNIRNIFDPSNYEPEFINLKNGGLLDGVHITIGREFRINGLGDFYRNNDVNAGDYEDDSYHDQENEYDDGNNNIKDNDNE